MGMSNRALRFAIKIRLHSIQQMIRLRLAKMRNWIISQFGHSLSADELLSPRILKRDDLLYVSALKLKAAISNNDCKNIALTGMYGSGKSSVIRTALKDIPKRKILNISFVNFEESDDNNKINVENKIFQHILYKASESKTRRSNVYRISHKPAWKIIAMSLWLVTVLFSFLVVIGEQWWFAPNSIYSLYFELGEPVRAIIKLITQCGALINVILFLIFLICKMYQFLANIHLKSLDAKYIKLEWENGPKSNFDSLLGEILYFLKAGQYKVVVFEDLDRIRVSSSLFIKLREINMLLNESAYFNKCHRVIHFIYAIRDDVYHTDLRTKCFDYVIPVVPVVDKNNMGEYLINLKKAHENKLQSINDVDLLRLGTFIPGRRELSNIFNEYMVYRSVIDKKNNMSDRIFLTLIIYKNLYPHDFSQAYIGRGCLFSVFANKKKFSNKINSDKISQKTQCENDITEIKNELVIQRSLITDYLENEGITHLIINNKSIPVSEFAYNEVFFRHIMANDIQSSIHEDGKTANYKITFDSILENIAEGDGYTGKHASSLEHLSQKQQEKSALEQEILHMESNALGTQLKQMSSEDAKFIITEICKEALKDDSQSIMTGAELQSLVNVLYELISAGYIPDEYNLYISVPYNGTLTEEETKFIHSIMQRKQYLWWDTLPNVANVIKHLNTDDFSDESILNYDILNYLLENYRGDSQLTLYLQEFVKTSRKEPDFAKDGEHYIERFEEYLSKLFDGWNDCIWAIAEENDITMQHAMFRLLFIACPQTKFAEADVNIMAANYKLICDYIKDIKLKELFRFIKNNNIRFTEIYASEEPLQKQLFDYVVANGYFLITMDNLRQIYGDDVSNRAVTVIYNDQNTERKKYFISKMREVLAILPDTDTEEEAQVIAQIINTTNLSDAESFVKRQRNNVDMTDINDVAKKQALLIWDKINPTWENIADAITNESHSQNIDTFVNNHADELSKTKCTATYCELFKKELFLNNERLSLTDYAKLLSAVSINVSSTELKELKDGNEIVLEAGRMSGLINSKYLKYDAEMNAFIHSNYEMETYIQYILKYYSEFEADNDFNEDFSNAEGIQILRSDLTNTQKDHFLSAFYRMNKGEGNEAEYAELVCANYSETDRKYEDNEKEELFNALSFYPEKPNGDAWRLKIKIMNKMMNDIACEEADVENMIHILGGGYNELLTGKKYTEFDDNSENKTFLTYVKKIYSKRVSRVYPSPINEGKLRVTFRNR